MVYAETFAGLRGDYEIIGRFVGVRAHFREGRRPIDELKGTIDKLTKVSIAFKSVI